MAHKKGVGSSKNGRESFLVVRLASLVTLSFVSVVQFTTQVRT